MKALERCRPSSRLALVLPPLPRCCCRDDALFDFYVFLLVLCLSVAFSRSIGYRANVRLLDVAVAVAFDRIEGKKSKAWLERQEKSIITRVFFILFGGGHWKWIEIERDRESCFYVWEWLWSYSQSISDDAKRIRPCLFIYRSNGRYVTSPYRSLRPVYNSIDSKPIGSAREPLFFWVGRRCLSIPFILYVVRVCVHRLVSRLVLNSLWLLSRFTEGKPYWAFVCVGPSMRSSII